MFKELWIKNKVNVELLKEILHILKVWIEKFQYVNKKSDSLSSILWIIYYDRLKIIDYDENLKISFIIYSN